MACRLIYVATAQPLSPALTGDAEVEGDVIPPAATACHVCSPRRRLFTSQRSSRRRRHARQVKCPTPLVWGGRAEEGASEIERRRPAITLSPPTSPRMPTPRRMRARPFAVASSIPPPHDPSRPSSFLSVFQKMPVCRQPTTIEKPCSPRRLPRRIYALLRWRGVIYGENAQQRRRGMAMKIIHKGI